ncbi:MAG: aldo/keto reductase [Candidatus Marinimicrobia bacterium]|jgi:aryl-alcohol dehydrogenase-like predicted oxidoreductase|nr:aldo/keto reductase [Candidatus Neomarinimicrobiota bacterium]MBT5440724.1 aldo/keto reductase [Candidatus Neomarinimicrobiota bacterium]MBT7423441.1 aldo/keto reductase [Candidatus Neomarinimicrobiota bacterium]
MKYKILGKTGIEVSELCLGTMSFGGQADEKESAKIFKQCRDAGINFFDCANVYEKGKSETILGKLIQGNRNDLVITSKAYFPTSNDVNARGGTRKHIMTAINESLNRLNTDYIDIYFLHRFDDLTPIEETLRVLEDLVKSGKVLYLGASNFAAWQIAKAVGISEKNCWNRFECIQPMYNLVKRQAEVEIFPMAVSENIGVINYSPTGGGLLSGKYAGIKRPKIGRLIENKMYEARYNDSKMFDVAEKFATLSKKLGYSPISLAIAWAKSHPAVTAPIIGGRNTEQLKDSINSLKIEMTSELREKISNISIDPPPATDRNEENTEHNYGQR